MVLLLRILAVLLITAPFIPLNFFAEYFSLVTFNWLMTARYWLMTSFTLLSITWLLCLLLPANIKTKFIALLTFCYRTLINTPVKLIILLILGETFLISWLVFEFKPGLVDSIIQVYQAKIFAAGQLAVKHELFLPFFNNPHMIGYQDAWFSQYPPGHSIILAIGQLFKSLWIMPIVTTTLAAFFIYQVGLLSFGTNIGKLSLWLLLICPYFLAQGVSFMNHSTALCFLAMFVYACLIWELQKKA